MSLELAKNELRECLETSMYLFTDDCCLGDMQRMVDSINHFNKEAILEYLKSKLECHDCFERIGMMEVGDSAESRLLFCMVKVGHT